MSTTFADVVVDTFRANLTNQESKRPAVQNERHGRTSRRQPRPAARRTGTRAGAIRHAIQEG